MITKVKILSCILAITVVIAKMTLACTLCTSVKLVSTIREDLNNPTTNLVFAGKLGKTQINTDGSGTTEFFVKSVLRKPSGWEGGSTLIIPKYLPGGEKTNQSMTVILANWKENQITPIRAINLNENESLREIVRITNAPTKQDINSLTASFALMGSKEFELSNDAFMEWAKADDLLVSETAKLLSPKLVRDYIQSSQSPQNRLSLYAYLLGCCGNQEDDSAWFAKCLNSKETKWLSARDGVMAGYLLLNPTEGWELAAKSLADSSTPLQDRLAILRSIKTLHNSEHPGTNSKFDNQIIQCLKNTILQKELADIAIDYLRQWHLPQAEEIVLAAYPRKGESPLLARSVIQYSLSFRERPKCATFLADQKLIYPDLIREVEDLLGDLPHPPS